MNFTSSTRKEIYVHDKQLMLNVGTATNLMELVGAINREMSVIPPTLPEWIYNGAIVAVQGGTQNVSLNLTIVAISLHQTYFLRF